MFSARTEKLRYMHRNPMKHGLVERPEDWKWSSYRHYLRGTEGVVDIESHWLARQRERMDGNSTQTEIYKAQGTSGLNAPPFAKTGRKGGPTATLS